MFGGVREKRWSARSCSKGVAGGALRPSLSISSLRTVGRSERSEGERELPLSSAFIDSHTDAMVASSGFLGLQDPRRICSEAILDSRQKERREAERCLCISAESAGRTEFGSEKNESHGRSGSRPKHTQCNLSGSTAWWLEAALTSSDALSISDLSRRGGQ
jgi:hypothetical protein